MHGKIVMHPIAIILLNVTQCCDVIFRAKL